MARGRLRPYAQPKPNPTTDWMFAWDDFSRLHQFGDEIGLNNQDVSRFAAGDLLVDHRRGPEHELELISSLSAEGLGDLFKGRPERAVAHNLDLFLGTRRGLKRYEPKGTNHSQNPGKSLHGLRLLMTPNVPIEGRAGTEGSMGTMLTARPSRIGGYKAPGTCFSHSRASAAHSETAVVTSVPPRP